MTARLPTSLTVDIILKRLSDSGTPYYIRQTGNAGSGIITVKINDGHGKARLLTQMRDYLNDSISWGAALAEELVEESEADAYIQRSIDRDPDLWVIEIDDKTLTNPFEDTS